MQIFVDIVAPDGAYTAAAEPSFMAERMPLSILTAVIFLDAAGAGGAVRRPRLFHLEAGRFVDAANLAGAGIRDHDTVMIVNCDRAADSAPTRLAERWQREGGFARRGLHRGVGFVDQRRRERPRA